MKTILISFLSAGLSFSQIGPPTPQSGLPPTTTTDPTGRSCPPNSVLNYIPSGQLFTCKNGVYAASGGGSTANTATLNNFTEKSFSTATEMTASSPGAVSKVFADGFVRTVYGADDGTHFVVCPSFPCTTRTDTVVSAIPGQLALTMYEGPDGFAVIGLSSADYSSIVIIHLLNASGSSKNTNTLAISAEIGPLQLVKGADGFPQGVVGDIAGNKIRTIHCANADGSSCTVSTGIDSTGTFCDAAPDVNGCYILSALLGADNFLRYAYINTGAIVYVRNRDTTGTLTPVSTTITSPGDIQNYNVQIGKSGAILVIAYADPLGSNNYYLAVTTCTSDTAVSCTVPTLPTWQLLKTTGAYAPSSMTIAPNGFPVIIAGSSDSPGLSGGPYYIIVCGDAACTQANATVTTTTAFWFGDTGSTAVSVTSDGILNLAAIGATSQLMSSFRGAAPYGAYSITSAAIGSTVTLSPQSPISVTLPQAGTAGFTSTAQFTVINSSSVAVTIIPATSTIFGLASLSLAGGSSALIYSDGTNYIAPPAAQNYLKASLNLENPDPLLFWWNATLAGGGAASVAYFASDSIAYGSTLATPYTQNFTGVMKQRLAGLYPDGGDGFQYFRQSASSTIADGACVLGSCSWASTGTWVRGPAGYGVINSLTGAERTPLSAGSSATATLTSAYFVNIDVYYICTSDTSAGFSVNIDASGASTYGAANCGTPTWRRQNIVSTIGTHSVVFTAPGSGHFYFLGVGLNVGGNGSIQWNNAAIPGTSAHSWCANPNFIQNAGFLAVFPSPNLIIVDTVANDFAQNSVAGFTSDLDSCLSNISTLFPAASLLVLSTHRYNVFSSGGAVEDQYYQVQRELAQKYGAAYVNVADRWGSLQQELAAGFVFSVDDYHATIAGNKDYASVLLNRIFPTSWGGVVPGGTNGQVQYNNAGVLGGVASTGTGSVARATSPTFITPVLGTPTSGVFTNGTGYLYANLVGAPLAYLSGTSSSIGGSVLVAGACSSGTVTVTGATTGMAAIASPAGGVDPTNGGILGVAVDARVSSSNTVTVSVCSPIAGTPAAAAYNVRVIQ